MTPSTLATPDAAQPVALITGSAKRLGAFTARTLHQRDYRVIIHYHESHLAAQALVSELNALRPDSARCVAMDLQAANAGAALADASLAQWQRIDVLINNASAFYPTPVGSIESQDWQRLFASNAQAPLFLSQALADELAKRQGAIINMIDIHAERPLSQHVVYCMAKSALRTLTLALACELAPAVRVNGIAPGAILWPEQANGMTDAARQAILQRIPLGRLGSEADIAHAIQFLLDASYITGQIIAVDGGRSLV